MADSSSKVQNCAKLNYFNQFFSNLKIHRISKQKRFAFFWVIFDKLPCSKKVFSKLFAEFKQSGYISTESPRFEIPSIRRKRPLKPIRYDLVKVHLIPPAPIACPPRNEDDHVFLVVGPDGLFYCGHKPNEIEKNANFTEFTEGIFRSEKYPDIEIKQREDFTFEICERQ